MSWCAKMKTLAVMAVALLAFNSQSNAAVVVFLSEATGVGQGAAVGNPAGEMLVSETPQSRTLGVWVNHEGLVDNSISSIFIDVTTDNPDVLRFTGGEVFNASIPAFPAPLPRWQTPGVSVDNNVVTLSGLNVTAGYGLNPLAAGAGGTEADFFENGNFLLGTVEFDLVGEGQANIFMQIGAQGILPGNPGGSGSSSQVDVTFGDSETRSLNAGNERLTPSDVPDASYKVNPDDVIIPEPATLSFLGLASLAFVRRRA